MLGLLARADPRIVSDDVWVQLRLSHVAEQRRSPETLLNSIARAGPSGVADDVGLLLRLSHLAAPALG